MTRVQAILSELAGAPTTAPDLMRRLGIDRRSLDGTLGCLSIRGRVVIDKSTRPGVWRVVRTCAPRSVRE